MRKVMYLILVFLGVVVPVNSAYADETYQSVNTWPVRRQEFIPFTSMQTTQWMAFEMETYTLATSLSLYLTSEDGYGKRAN